MLVTLLLLGALSLLSWITVALRPGRPWEMRPVAEDEPEPPPPAAWPAVSVVVPARNEREALPATLPALLAQDYPGPWQVLVVDDRSTDGTGDLAAGLGAGRARVLRGSPLPEGWQGKVWALDQGARATRDPYLLLTDADILHAAHGLRRLVSESEAGALALNSRMARLRCESPAERLLIPPFVWFFGLLYPLSQVNRPECPAAAAAGGCILVRRDALERAGGFAAIRGHLIDDVNLARRVKDSGGKIRLTLSRQDVRSLRPYPTVGSVWRMVRRTAFTELRSSWLRLGATLAGLALLFAAPPALAVAGGVLARGDSRFWLVTAAGAAAWGLQAWLHRPAPRFFGLSGLRAALLPLAGALYGLMTFDSALRGGRKDWR